MSEQPILKRPVSRPTETPPPSSPPTVLPAAPLTPPVITNPRDLDRSRAEAAWNAIQEVNQDSEYGSLAREMPTYIQVNGLAQTLAFLKANKKKHHHLMMFNHLSNWVCQQLKFKDGDLLSHVLKIDNQSYRRATTESLAFLQWLKRFSEAVIDKKQP